MITANSTLLQVHRLYLREIKPKEHQNWRYNLRKYHNISTADRKSHNYAVNLLVKATDIPYSVELTKLMNLIINEKFSIRKMSIVKLDIALFKLSNGAIIQLIIKYVKL